AVIAPPDTDALPGDATLQYARMSYVSGDSSTTPVRGISSKLSPAGISITDGGPNGTSISRCSPSSSSWQVTFATPGPVSTTCTLAWTNVRAPPGISSFLPVSVPSTSVSELPSALLEPNVSCTNA